ncbi:hypothetical protein ACPYO6_12070 [Georgenia sp. Z1344]|uniref:hypothetical protein n=1 Tax=Georgenia sp. Z1344 TaxID=3416706 RepID=UPI003CF09452
MPDTFPDGVPPSSTNGDVADTYAPVYTPTYAPDAGQGHADAPAYGCATATATATEQDPADDAPFATSPARRGGRARIVALATLVAALALVAGFLGGRMTADPTASEEYAGLEGRLTTAESERDEALTTLGTTEGDLASAQQQVTDVTAERDQALTDLDNATAGHDEREAGLDEREVGLDERESGLDTRETEISERETDIGERETEVGEREVAVGAVEEEIDSASFGAGTHLVGTDIAPGTYRSTGTGDGCYWERLAGTSGELSDIIANDFTSNPGSIVTIAASDVAFSSNRCGSWEPVQ